MSALKKCFKLKSQGQDEEELHNHHHDEFVLKPNLPETGILGVKTDT